MHTEPGFKQPEMLRTGQMQKTEVGAVELCYVPEQSVAVQFGAEQSEEW